MGHMGKRKQKPEPQREEDMPATSEPKKKQKPQPNRKGLSIHVYLDADVRAALDNYMGSSDLQPNATRIINLALKRYLQSVGFWPPPAPSS
jgi:hypothetical protein